MARNGSVQQKTDATNQTKVRQALSVDPARFSDTVARIMLTGRQIRAGLALIGKDVAWLAQAAVVSEGTVRRSIVVDDTPRLRADSLAKIQRVLEAEGCLFLDPHDRRDGGEGVRLRPPPAPPVSF
jgi:hypothetical protein